MTDVNLETQLAERLRFETLLAELSARFVGLPADALDDAIEESQRLICETLGLDRSSLVQFTGGKATFTHSWAVAGFSATPLVPVEELCPWSLQQIRAGASVRFSTIDELPAEAAIDKESFRRLGPKSNVTFPLVVGGEVLGALAFGSLTAERQWQEDLIGRLRFAANMFATALARRRSDEALHESEARLNLAMDSAQAGLWSVEFATQQVWLNDRMRELCQFAPGAEITAEDLFQLCHPEDRASVRQSVRHATRSDALLVVEHRIVLPGERIRWIAVRGHRRCKPSGEPIRMTGAVVDVTERKKAEDLARQHLQELAHLNRVSALGELTTSLAHELNQPLGAILRNAEAAEVLLRSDAPDLDELRAIVGDIRKDDTRAGSVIERLRTLLKRRRIELQRVDLAPLVAEVVALVRFDAIARRVQLKMDIPADLPAVQADRVHLQQVLLNLVMNAMDAVNEAPDGDRCVDIRARLSGAGSVEVAVCDGGHGLTPSTVGRLFEPFFTTKAEGMGMGLPIARTIIEAHNGRIWAESNSVRGATLFFTLVAAPSGALQ